MRCLLPLLLLLPLAFCQITPVPKMDITPIPIDKTDPNVKEFQRIDSNKDGQLTFTEFLLSDRPFLEHQSRRFHGFDMNGDGVVTKKEFKDYFKKLEKHKRRSDMFFNKFNRDRRDPFQASFFDSFPKNPQVEEGSRELSGGGPLHNPSMVLL
ncbi:hypothetical protein L5515_012169 [Caenorhabditis briggsae]|uniref:EF-hand domain-containing protein n=1 Tax=Caenorhabditis briggsae TaxID=6238 RepID=A0AAE9EYM9_CAEBR|nr:hypothetical protein L5515_012169 [Caenorhabditis briggsae]